LKHSPTIDLSIVKLLIKSGVKLRQIDKKGNTALKTAMFHKQMTIEVLEFLIKAGEDVL
jgi:ankyrin repeat protein